MTILLRDGNAFQAVKRKHLRDAGAFQLVKREMVWATEPNTPLPDIQFIGSSPAVTGTTAATIPAHQAGDLLLLVAGAGGTHGNPPAGWTLAGASTVTSSSLRGTSIFYKFGDGVETSVTMPGSYDKAVVVYRNAAGIGQVATQTSGTATGTISELPSIATLAEGSHVLAGIHQGVWRAGTVEGALPVRAGASTIATGMIVRSRGPLSTLPAQRVPRNTTAQDRSVVVEILRGTQRKPTGWHETYRPAAASFVYRGTFETSAMDDWVPGSNTTGVSWLNTTPLTAPGRVVIGGTSHPVNTNNNPEVGTLKRTFNQEVAGLRVVLRYWSRTGSGTAREPRVFIGGVRATELFDESDSALLSTAYSARSYYRDFPPDATDTSVQVHMGAQYASSGESTSVDVWFDDWSVEGYPVPL